MLLQTKSQSINSETYWDLQVTDKNLQVVVSLTIVWGPILEFDDPKITQWICGVLNIAEEAMR